MSKSRVLPLALLAATVGAAGCLWLAWCEFPFHAWNDVRLAPAFALRHGVQPYPLLGGGPLFTWIYGPIGIFINLPATFAASPVAALHIASVINALTVLGPLAIIFFGSPELRARGPGTCAVALALATLFIPRPNLIFQVADHLACAFGLLSCWVLVRHPGATQRSLVAAALLCTLAVWSKQIAVFLLPAQVAYLMIAHHRTAAFRYAAWVALFSLGALALFSAIFGFENLWLNLVAIPGRLPWADFWPRLTVRSWALVAQIALPALLLLLIWRKGAWPGRDRESGRFFQVSVLAAAAMLPVGLTAFFKIGGDTNVLHSWDYLLPALLLAWLAHDATPAGAASFRLLAAVVIGLGLRAKDLVSLPGGPITQHYDSALQLAAAHPHALWFPQHPVLTFYADGTLWHSEDGVLTRYAADYRIREPDFRRHLPPDLEGVAYRWFVTFPFAMPLLPEFDHSERFSEWKLHTRPLQPVVAR
jgi:hypothetical protein